MAYRRSYRTSSRRYGVRSSASRTRARPRSRTSRRGVSSARAQTVRLVIETSPASAVSRQLEGAALKLNPPPKKSKF